MIVSSFFDWKFLKKTGFVMFLYGLSVFLLLFLFIVGSVFKGAQSWFDLGALSFQPVDFAKLATIILLAKYFSRRHIEIANIRHILVSGFYTFIIFLLVFLQPDFGSAIIIFSIWLCLIFVSGISKKHLLGVFLIGLTCFGFLWQFVFKPYQKERIINFVNPMADISGGGYNVYQSTIAIGSGQVFGKGIGLGSQSKLKFLPEYQTDFIFSAFAEEWGFVGVIIIFILFTIVLVKIIRISLKGESNFEILFGVGIFVLLSVHITINIGMTIGLLPVTGNTLPFMSYGGSHLLNEFLAIGILMGMNRRSRSIHKDIASNEIIGLS
jgi:rod shape determining protein RodA